MAICISEKRGTEKTQTDEADIIENWGIKGDAHGGNWHRQISLISADDIDSFNARGANVKYGAFGENIVVRGIDLTALTVGSKLKTGNVILEITQIGKECHSHCNIFKRMGECIMPHKGVFAKVLRGGHIKKGDEMKVIMEDEKRSFRAAVITLSDKGAAGERIDKSGPAAAKILRDNGYIVEEEILIPDDSEKLKRSLIDLADRRRVDLIITTGGTGFSPRDITPEATAMVCDRMAYGIAEAIRAYSMTITKRAMLGRGVAGIRSKTLIVNLPGSPKAVKESLEYIISELSHGIDIMRGTGGECGR